MPFSVIFATWGSSWMGALLLRIEICHMQNLLSSDQTQLLGDLVNLSVCARKSWKKYKGKKLIWFQCTAIVSKILSQVGAVKLCLLSYVSRSWCKIAVTLFGLPDFSGFLVLIRVVSWRPRCLFGVHRSIISSNAPNQFSVLLLFLWQFANTVMPFPS